MSSVFSVFFSWSSFKLCVKSESIAKPKPDSNEACIQDYSVLCSHMYVLLIFIAFSTVLKISTLRFTIYGFGGCCPRFDTFKFLCLWNFRWITCALVGCAPPWNSIVPYASVGCGRVCLFGSHKSPSDAARRGGRCHENKNTLTCNRPHIFS